MKKKSTSSERESRADFVAHGQQSKLRLGSRELAVIGLSKLQDAILERTKGKPKLSDAEVRKAINLGRL